MYNSNVTIKQKDKVMGEFQICAVILAIWIVLISIFVAKMFECVFAHLRQIEKKIDQIHLEWRKKEGFVYPEQYPFDTKVF